jgi:hypothetical protein
MGQVVETAVAPLADDFPAIEIAVQIAVAATAPV